MKNRIYLLGCEWSSPNNNTTADVLFTEWRRRYAILLFGLGKHSFELQGFVLKRLENEQFEFSFFNFRKDKKWLVFFLMHKQKFAILNLISSKP